MIEQTKAGGKIVGLIHPHNKISSESMRWMTLAALEIARPRGASEEFMLSINRIVHTEETALDVRRELDFLADLGLVEISKKQGSSWIAWLTQDGVDVIKYTRKAYLQ